MPAPYEGQSGTSTPRQRSLGPPDAKAMQDQKTGKQRSRSPTKDVEYRECVTDTDQYVNAASSSEYMPARRRPTSRGSTYQKLCLSWILRQRHYQVFIMLRAA